MTKYLGNRPALYAAPLAVTGTMAEGKTDCRALKPVLFQFPAYKYLKTGDVVGKCRSYGK